MLASCSAYITISKLQLCVGVAENGREKFPAGGEGEEELFARNAEKSDCMNNELWREGPARYLQHEGGACQDLH